MSLSKFLKLNVIGTFIGVVQAVKLNLSGELKIKGIRVKKGDLIVGTASHIPSILSSGENGQILSANSSKSYGLEWINHDASSHESLGISHSSLSNLSEDDHSQYVLLNGRNGGQTIYGGTGSGENLVLEGTSHSNKSSSKVILQPSAGNVGIGVTNPEEKLQVNGAIRIPSASNEDNNSPGLIFGSDDDFLFNGEYINHYGFGFHTPYGLSPPDKGAYVSGCAGISLFTSGALRLTVDPNGNVGIGISEPQHKLQVAGAIASQYVAYDIIKIGPLGNSPSYFYINTNIQFYPAAYQGVQLWIRGYGYSGPDTDLVLSFYTYTGEWYGVKFHSVPGKRVPSRIRLGTWNDGGTKKVRIEIANDGHYWTSYFISAYMHQASVSGFAGWTWSEGEFPQDTEDIVTVPQAGDAVVNSAGNVGIGVTNPEEKLTVNGNIKTSLQFISSVITGTAPIVVNSITICSNLNADMVDGYHLDQSLKTTDTPSFVNIELSNLTDGYVPYQNNGVLADSPISVNASGLNIDSDVSVQKLLIFDSAEVGTNIKTRLYSNNSNLYLTNNAYYSESDWNRDDTDYKASMYSQVGGFHYFYTAPATSNPIDWEELVKFDNTGIYSKYGFIGSLLQYKKSYSKYGYGWFSSAVVSQVSTTNVTLEASKMYACPFIVVTRESFDAMGINVVTAVSGSQVLLGIYSDDDGYPTNLIKTAGSVSGASVGAKIVTMDTVTLEPGLYWLVAHSNSYSGLSLSAHVQFPLILGSSNPGDYMYGGWEVSRTWTGSLPSTFPSGATPNYKAMVFIRKA